VTLEALKPVLDAELKSPTSAASAATR